MTTIYRVEYYFTQSQTEPHVKDFSTLGEARDFKAGFYTRRGYHYAEIHIVNIFR